MKKPKRATKLLPPKKAVSKPAKVTIHILPTGVGGLAEISGGGVPAFSFNITAGPPGCGKTTLAHQIVFANATVRKPALCFTVLGKPAIKDFWLTHNPLPRESHAEAAAPELVHAYPTSFAAKLLSPIDEAGREEWNYIEAKI